jgi:hypothetical protein
MQAAFGPISYSRASNGSELPCKSMTMLQKFEDGFEALAFCNQMQ